MKSSFWPFDKRLRVIDEQIKPGYAALKASSLGSTAFGVPAIGAAPAVGR